MEADIPKEWKEGRVKLLHKGGRCSKGMDWTYDDTIYVCGTKETVIHVLLECKCYDMVRR